MPVFADALPMPDFEYYPRPYNSGLDNLGSILGVFMLIIILAFIAYWIVCLWRIFKKAGLPGRGSLIPVYREYLWFKMIGRNGRWTATLLCPVMFAILLIFSFFKVSEKFGKDKEQFSFGLWFLNPIFLGILAFDKSKYKK